MNENKDELLQDTVVPYRTLILCKRNTCRSVIYHSLALCERRTNHVFFSAGVDIQQRNIDPNTIKVLKDNNISLAKNIPSPVSYYKGYYFDKVIILDKEIDQEILKSIRCVKIEEKFLEDPLGKPFEKYQKAFDEIQKIVKIR